MADEGTLRLRMPRFGKDLSDYPLPVKALVAAAILVLIGGIAAPSAVTPAAILSTLPYFAILAVASMASISSSSNAASISPLPAWCRSAR